MRPICYLSCLFLLLAAMSCGAGADEETNASNGTVASAPAREVALISNINYLRLRDMPGPDGEVLANLSEGDTLYDMGEVSAFTTEVTLRGIRFNEPWIRVRTRDSLVGWVYAGGLHFRLDDRSELTRRLMELRLQTFFGDSLARRTLDHRLAFRNARSSQDIAGVYREACSLRDALVSVLDQRITLIQLPDQAPDLTWMEEALPGMIAQRVAEGASFYLFFDFRPWQQKSRETKGSEDDRFFDVCLTAYSLDSIEYFFPNWIIQVPEETTYSDLGKGLHLQMLEKMNQALAASSLFEPEYQQLKTALLEDILASPSGYWNGQEAILRELDAIIAADFGLLTPGEKNALKERREQFAQAEANNLQLNFRAGNANK